MSLPPTGSIDALLPPEMAAKAEQIGVKKATMAALPLFALAVLAGAFIALGGAFALVAATGADGFGLTRLLMGVAFSVGLILVVVGGAELFTGNNLIVMAWAGGKVTTVQLLRNWAIVYCGNLLGAVGIAVLAYFAGFQHLGGDAVQRVVLTSASAKCKLGFGEAVALGVLCNVLVCLAVWMTYSCHSTTDKVLVIVPPIACFVACGFEHSVANMFTLPFALMVDPSGVLGITPERALVANLLPVTIGNVIGGGVLVAGVYWFVYLTGRQRPPADPGAT
jgi:formate/nitrite transporter